LSESLVRGGFVKKGQLLARIDPSDYEAAMIDAESSLASANAALEQERAQGLVAKKEWKRITDASPTELSLRKPQLAQELARLRAAEASILRAKRNLERTELRAPYDAMIDGRNIGLGSFVGVGNTVGKLLSTDIAEVRLPVADNQLQYLIDHGKLAKVNLIGTFAGIETTWQASIIRNEGVIDNKSRMSYLVAQINDPYALKSAGEQTPIRFGSYVNAKIQGLEISQATILPRYLLNNNRVALLDKNSKLHYAKVNIVRQVGGNVIVSEGLANGDSLIVSALDYPVDGMKLALPSDVTDGPEPEFKEKDDTQIASVKD